MKGQAKETLLVGVVSHPVTEIQPDPPGHRWSASDGGLDHSGLLNDEAPSVGERRVKDQERLLKAARDQGKGDRGAGGGAGSGADRRLRGGKG